METLGQDRTFCHVPANGNAQHCSGPSVCYGMPRFAVTCCVGYHPFQLKNIRMTIFESLDGFEAQFGAFPLTAPGSRAIRRLPPRVEAKMP
jgi:hypothetical protein